MEQDAETDIHIEHKVNIFSVMRIRIHKIWSMRIRIQNKKITKFISNHLLKVKKKKKIFSDLYLNLRAGIYIMQNTMVRGGGNGQPGKKNLIRS